MDDHKQILVLLLGGTVLWGITYLLIGHAILSFLAAGILMCVVMGCVTYMFPYREPHLSDERTEQQAHRALAYSWFCTLLGLNILFWLQVSGLTNVSANEILLIVWLCMSISGVFFLFRRDYE